MSRRKGAVGEREAAHFWQAVFPDCARRACGEESQERQGADLKGTWPFVIQVKTTARPDEVKALHEAIAAVRDPREIPFAHCRKVLRAERSTIYAATVTFRASDARLLVAVYERFRASFPSRVEEIRAELNGEEE